jgi:molybdopterin-guanine dinucleotide biosynthesis protein A
VTSFLDKQKITGVVLSGGLSRRMGGQEKALINFKGKAMISHVLERLKPQVATVIINTNRQIEQYKQLGYPIISDQFGHFDGPLAGIYSALLETKTAYLLVVPCDSPLISHNLVERLYFEMAQADSPVALAHDGERLQPVFALISTALTASLKQYLQSGQRKLDRWFEENKATIVDFSDSKKMFYNINTAEELQALEDKG